MKAVFFLAPDHNEDGSYSMNYDDNNLLAGILQQGSGQEDFSVSLIAIGEVAAKPVLREALAMGADRALLLTGMDPWNWLHQAYCLSQAIGEWGDFQLFCAGGCTAQEAVGIMTAELLDIPQVTQVTELCWQDGRLQMKKNAGEIVEYIGAPMPCFVNNSWTSEIPRTLAFSDIQASMEKELEIRAAGDGLWNRDCVQVLASGMVKQQRLGLIAAFGDGDEVVLRGIQKSLAGVICSRR